MDDTRRRTIFVTDATWRAARLAAIETGRTVSQVVEGAIQYATGPAKVAAPTVDDVDRELAERSSKLGGRIVSTAETVMAAQARRDDVLRRMNRKT